MSNVRMTPEAGEFVKNILIARANFLTGFLESDSILSEGYNIVLMGIEDFLANFVLSDEFSKELRDFFRKNSFSFFELASFFASEKCVNVSCESLPFWKDLSRNEQDIMRIFSLPLPVELGMAREDDEPLEGFMWTGRNSGITFSGIRRGLDLKFRYLKNSQKVLVCYGKIIKVLDDREEEFLKALIMESWALPLFEKIGKINCRRGWPIWSISPTLP